ncbi:MAG: glycosyltransferase family 39 protein, partial [Candidatus Hydrogenedentes bacterium]|nr:glycosyltransferase family 39 protein [Candidatus Hydrogenedentota bacterium]
MPTPDFNPDPHDHGPARLEVSFRASCIAAFVMPVLLLLPFVNKPFHADDHVFVWVAQQIAEEPFDFFGFEVDYGYAQIPIYDVNHNPPGLSYFLVPFGLAGDWNEIPLHLGMLLFTGLAGLGIYLLARDLCPSPLLATAMTLLTPAFLVSASSLMTDIPLLACYVWTLYLWRRGLEADKRAYLAASALLMGAAFLCKFYGATLLPLLFAYSLVKKRAIGSWSLYFLIPVACIAVYGAVMYAAYGVVIFADAAGVALDSKWRGGETGATRWVLSLVFAGGAFLPLALYLRPLVSWRWLTVGAIAVTATVLPLIGGFSILQLLLGPTEPYAWPKLLFLAVLLFVGGGLLLVSMREAYGQRNADAILLALWILGTFLFTAAINHYVSVRTLLPMVPALGIVLARGLPGTQRYPWRTAVAGALCLWIVAGDYEIARHGKQAADEAVAMARDEGTPLYHVAFWGFEYYVMEAGSSPLSFESVENYGETPAPEMPEGALLVVHSHGAQAWKNPPRGFETVATLSYPIR